MEPLYYKIKKDLEDKINNNQYKKGEYIPSEPDLEKYYNVSRTTIRKAISTLCDEGLLTIIRGKGTKVTPSKLSHNTSKLMSFTEIMKHQGMVPSIIKYHVDRIITPKDIASKLSLDPWDEVYKIYRIRSADNEPISINTSYIPCKYLRDFDSKLLIENQSLYKTLEDRYNVSIQITEDTVTAVKANSNQADILDINKGDPVLCIERVAYNKNSSLVEFSEIIIRCDRYKHIITYKKK